MRKTSKGMYIYAGCWYRRMQECPYCHEIVFNGEWASSRADVGGSDEATECCPICAKQVPVYLLVQPREKRKGMHYFILSLSIPCFYYKFLIKEYFSYKVSSRMQKVTVKMKLK